MPFTFNLQPLLELRERIEDEKKRDFVQGMADHGRALATLQAARDELAASVAKLRSRLMRADPRAMEDAFAEITYLRAIVTESQAAVVLAEERLARLREALMAATKDKNVLEKLKERRREAYLEARRLREEEEMDDANVIRVSNAATVRREAEDLR